MPLEGTEDIRTRLRRALPAAMKARDQTTVAALRSALAAIDNAEAVEVGPTSPPGSGAPDLAGPPPPRRSGLGTRARCDRSRNRRPTQTNLPAGRSIQS